MIYVLKISGKETKMVCRDIKKMKNRERSKKYICEYNALTQPNPTLKLYKDAKGGHILYTHAQHVGKKKINNKADVRIRRGTLTAK